MIRIAFAALVALAASATPASAGEGPVVNTLRDPWVPPEVRAKPHRPPETHGDPLRSQAEAKLRASFAEADIEGRGSITREQARAANLGVIADNFEAMDTARSGRVTFEDFKRFLRARGAKTL